LQAADLVAYEIFRKFEALRRTPVRNMRWPMKQLLEMANIYLPRIRLLDRKELLRVIKESGAQIRQG
jgi:hypothetical protein